MKEKKVMSFLSYGQLNYKEFEINDSIGFFYENKYLYSTSNQKEILKNTTIFTLIVYGLFYCFIQ